MCERLKDILKEKAAGDCKIIVTDQSVFIDKLKVQRVTIIRQLGRLESQGFIKRIPILGRLSGYAVGGKGRTARAFGKGFSTLIVNVILEKPVNVTGLKKPDRDSVLYKEMLKIGGEEPVVIFDQSDMAKKLNLHRNSIITELNTLEESGCICRVTIAGRLNGYAIHDMGLVSEFRAKAMIKKKLPVIHSVEDDKSEAANESISSKHLAQMGV